MEFKNIESFTLKSSSIFFIKRQPGVIGSDCDTQAYYRSAEIINVGVTAFLVVDLECSGEKSRTMVPVADIEEMVFEI